MTSLDPEEMAHCYESARQNESETGSLMNAPTHTAQFKAFPQFTEGETDRLTSSSTSVDPTCVLRHFPTDKPADQIARILGKYHATSIKEVIESFEFFHQTRKRIRAHNMIDLCCGHGLTGMLFAALDRKVESVTLVDRQKPKCFDVILNALCELMPWTRDKVRYLEWESDDWDKLESDEDTSVLGVHACGKLTDRCLEFAVSRGLPIAVMPCCYPHKDCPAPAAVKKSLGAEVAFDIDRTYRLDAKGYKVQWGYIPKAVTPMNRILLAQNASRLITWGSS